MICRYSNDINLIHMASLNFVPVVGNSWNQKKKRSYFKKQQQKRKKFKQNKVHNTLCRHIPKLPY